MTAQLFILASNYQSHLPEQTAQRRVGRQIERVKQPMVVAQYNRGMGGVDVMDKLLGSYRPTIRGKKWWWPLFTNCLNISVVAAWKMFTYLHNIPGNPLVTHLEFKRTIVMCLITLMKMVANWSPHPGGRSVGFPADVRRDGMGHENAHTSQGRCVVCGTNTRNQCRKCSVRLHYSKDKSCFADYHTSN